MAETPLAMPTHLEQQPAAAGVSPTIAAHPTTASSDSSYEALKDHQAFPLATFTHHPAYTPDMAEQPSFPDTVPSSPYFSQQGGQSRSVSPFTLAQAGQGAGAAGTSSTSLPPAPAPGGRRKTPVVVLSDLENPELLGQPIMRGPNETSPPPPVKIFADQDSLDKYLRRRAKNNEAATKSRKKKKEQEEANYMKAKELADENGKLREELQALRAETKALKDMMTMMWQSKK